MHWGSAFMAGDGINALTNPAADPDSRQPELKHSAIAVEAAQLPWRAAGWIRGDAAALRRTLAQWLKRFPYVLLLPSAMAENGLRLSMAAAQAPALDVLQALCADLGLAQPDAAFDDPTRGVLRRVRLADGLPAAYLLAGDVRAHDAMVAWIDGGAAPASVGQLLMGRTAAVARARTICTCNGVTDQAIEAGIAAGLDLEGLKKTLGCATGCGSCAPEIARMIVRGAGLKEMDHAQGPAH
jgi:assimilatory nitrate reductase catalytic subunit